MPWFHSQSKFPTKKSIELGTNRISKGFIPFQLRYYNCFVVVLSLFHLKKKPILSVNWNIIVCAVKQHPFQSKNKVHRNDKVGVLTRLSLSHTISCWFKLSLWNLCKSHHREFVSEFWRKRRKGRCPSTFAIYNKALYRALYPMASSILWLSCQTKDDDLLTRRFFIHRNDCFSKLTSPNSSLFTLIAVVLFW